MAASLGNPRSWIPYVNSKDYCSQGLCSLHCPQWCYTVHPPPPPSRPNFSPLVIAISGILATAFLLVSYYAIISKFCGRRDRDQDHDDELMMQEHRSPSSLLLFHDVSTTTTTTGMDESLIKSITVVCKYKRSEDGLVTECSVCLSEFEDDESVRLLPKCSHAFHLPCIDTWLKSHSTCPLCRATIIFTNTFNAAAASPPPHNQIPPPATSLVIGELPSSSSSSSSSSESIISDEIVEEESTDGGTPEPAAAALRAFSDLGNMQGGRQSHRRIEIRDDDKQVYESIGITRSVSMDHYYHSLQEVVIVVEEGCCNSSNETEAGSSKRSTRGVKHSKVLRCILSPITMKIKRRPFSMSTATRFSPSLSLTTISHSRSGTLIHL